MEASEGNQPAVERSTLKQRYDPEPYVGSEMAEPCVSVAQTVGG